MITRGMQRISYAAQSIQQEQILLFSELIESWPSTGSSPSPITYGSGYFYIPNASLSDYLISWSISIKTATVLDGFENIFGLYMDYSNGEVTEGCFSSTILATGLVKGFKIIHVSRLSKNDLLSLCIKSNSFFNTAYLTTPIYPENLLSSQIANASISILSI